MSRIIENNLKELKEILDNNKELKRVVYISVGVISLYLIVKSFKTIKSNVNELSIVNSIINRF